MTVRHESLTLYVGVLIRRVHNDGQLPAKSLWAGRDVGWIPDTLDNRARSKVYSRKSSAKASLRLILAHERELGIANRIGRRY